MKTELAQHIYTSRRRFETVACSPGVDEAVVRALEERAGNYPSGDWNRGADAPRICRTFVPPPDRSSFAIMFLRNVAEDLSGRGGNYLAHTYLIARGGFETLGSNIAWIAVNLPVQAAYKSPFNTGREPLPTHPVDIDPAGQYPLLRFLAQEQSREWVERCATALLERTAHKGVEASTLEIHFGATHPDVQALFTAARPKANGELREVPHADVLNLFRCAGLLAILPQAFQAGASLSINEPTLTSGYTAIVLRSPAATSDVAAWSPVSPYVKYCVELALEERFEVLHRLVSWVNGILVEPSTDSLNLLFDLYIEASTQGDSPQDRSDARLISSLQRFRPLIPTLKIEVLLAWLERQYMGSGAPDAAAPALSFLVVEMLATQPGISLSEKLERESVEYLSTGEDGELEQKHQRYLALPEPFRLALWKRSEGLGCLPACVGAGVGETGILICLRAAESLAAAPDASELMKRLWSRIRGRVWVAQLGPSSWSRPALDLLRLLGGAQARKLAACFIEQVAAEVPWPRDSVTARFIAAEVVRQSLLALPTTEVIPETVANLLWMFSRGDDQQLLWPLAVHPPPAARQQMLAVLRAIEPRLPNGRARDFIGLLQELLQVAVGDAQAHSQRQPQRLLATPNYDRWTSTYIRRGRLWSGTDRELYGLHNLFRRNLMTEISQADVRMAAIIGATYLAREGDRSSELLACVITKLAERPRETERAVLEQDPACLYVNECSMAQVVADLLLASVGTDGPIVLGLIDALDRALTGPNTPPDQAARFVDDVEIRWRRRDTPLRQWSQWRHDRGLTGPMLTRR